MTTVTVEVEEDILARAAEVLAKRESTVTREVQETLRRIAEDGLHTEDSGEPFREFLARFRKFDTGGPFSRDEMNER